MNKMLHEKGRIISLEGLLDIHRYSTHRETLLNHVSKTATESMDIYNQAAIGEDANMLKEKLMVEKN